MIPKNPNLQNPDNNRIRKYRAKLEFSYIQMRNQLGVPEYYMKFRMCFGLYINRKDEICTYCLERKKN